MNEDVSSEEATTDDDYYSTGDECYTTDNDEYCSTDEENDMNIEVSDPSCNQHQARYTIPRAIVSFKINFYSSVF